MSQEGQYKPIVRFGIFPVLAFALLLTSRSVSAAETADAVNPQKQAELLKAVSGSLVQVEYTLQYNQAEAPNGSGWATRCPNCGQYHGENIDSLLPEDRPALLGGYLVAPDQVIAPDFMLHPRFIKKISIRAGSEVVGATIKKWYSQQNAVLLKLEKPLANAKPLSFEPGAAGPYQAVEYVNENAEWQLSVKPLAMNITTLASGYSFIPAPSASLILSADGKPVALSMNEELNPDGSWKMSPTSWAGVDEADMVARLKSLGERADKSILHVMLTFRSPPQSEDQMNRYVSRFPRGQADENATEQHAIGLLYSPTKLLILSLLKPGVTGRLEQINVLLPDGKTAKARFEGSLTDYGALIATLEQPLDSPLALSDQTILTSRNRLLYEAEVRIDGETRVAYTGHRRIAGFKTGWREQVYPEFPGEIKGRFLFDDAGHLVSLPILRREKINDDRSYRSVEPVYTGASYLAAVLKDPSSSYDLANVPLSEEQEHRLAWLGVELQAMTPELAKANKVSTQTGDGETGALVTYVYPDSPAARAGIEVGAVLLRVHVKNQPQPMNVKIEAYMFADQPFPWDHYEELTERSFERVPRPWPPAETPLTRGLTDLGFGQEIELEYAVDGQTHRKAMVVTESPAHYDTAKRATSDAMGLTVREMTYEVRRYFQRKSDEPGVIISQIEAGSKASRAGLKPFEFITHINDQPVTSAADFERMIKPAGDLQLSVRRMTRGRVVKITLDQPAK